MEVYLTATTTSLSDILDRVLDRGIVIEAWIGVSIAGIRLVDVDSRVVVASIPTYMRLAPALAARAAAGARPDEEGRPPDVAGPAPRQRRRRSRPRPKPPQLSGGFHCPQGCTFERAAVATAENPTPRVRCPYRPGANCVLKVLV